MTSKVTSCPAWCIVHRTNDRGWSFHIGEMQYAGGMYVGLQQNRRGGIGPAVAIFRTMGDESPVAVLDEYDAAELGDALVETAGELEAAKRDQAAR